jgi:hypothetical protein
MKSKFQITGLVLMLLATLIISGVMASGEFPSPTPTANPAAASSLTATPQVSTSPTTLDGSGYFGKPVNIKAGDTLVINLPSNVSTGFSWQIT